MMRKEPIANKRRYNASKRAEAINGYLFVAPIVIGTVIFSIVPILYSFYLSLMNWDGLGEKIFIGFDNFVDIFKDATLLQPLSNTLYYTLGTVPLGMILAVFLANILNKKIVGKGIFRVIYYLPNVTMAAAVAIVWRWIFNSEYGLINLFLGSIGLPQPSWLGDPNFIMPAIIMVSIWGSIGYNMVFILSGMQNIPEQLIEAAKLDGANGRNIFWKITLPILTPTLFFLLTMSVMGALKVFDIVFMFAGGGQMLGGAVVDASKSLVYGIFENAFTLMKMGVASAQAVVLFGLILVVTIIQFALQKKWVYYD